MDARTLSIKTIFGQDRRHLVPLFQRPYVWNRTEQWEPLWEDIRALADRLLSGGTPRSHFLGAIVLDQLRKPTGHVETRLVIDGQQRLTTIQLFIEAFSDFCGTKNIDRFHRALLKLTRNDDPMSDDDDEVYKVWPTNVDQGPFRWVMDASSPSAVRKAFNAKETGDAGHQIADAYLFFYESLSNWLTAVPEIESRVEALFSAVRDYVRMVVIDLEREDDAQLIFETLNARGTPLLPSDLVKNFLFHRAQIEGAPIEPLYNKYWRSFDERSGYWRAEIGRGHARRTRIDLFLQHYLTLRVVDEIPIGHLYTAFREHAADGRFGTAEEVLRSLRKYAQIYESFDQMDAQSPEGVFFQRLGALDVTTAYPFLLQVFATFKDESEARSQILADLESFLVRRTVCQLNTRGYNRLFLDLLKTVDGKNPHKRVREFLLASTAESNRWPSDEEFREAWIAVPVYEGLVRSRVRLLLEALEEQLYDGKGERIGATDRLTIEHLMPQEWRPHWPLQKGAPEEEVVATRERLLHTIGNLTLLTNKLNPSVSNGPWEKKIEGILDHSALALNRPLQKCVKWDETEILKRSDKLFRDAIQIWPRPKQTASA